MLTRVTVTVIFCFATILSGCASHVWQYSGTITPMNGMAAQAEHRKSVGVLRRVIVLPASFDWNKPAFERKPSETEQIAYKKGLASDSRSVLVNKGYDAMPLDAYEGMYQAKLGLTELELRQMIAALMYYAATSQNGADSPEAIRDMVQRIGRPLSADAILALQGHSYFCKPGYYSALFTAMLAWPVWMACDDYRLRSDIYEVYSGRIVWRAEEREIEPRHLDPRRVLSHIEPAVRPSAQDGSGPVTAPTDHPRDAQ